MNWVIGKVLGSVIARWVTVSIVAALLGGVAWKWYKFKEDLRDEGIQECVQEINQATVDTLKDALAAEKLAVADLRAKMAAAAAANQEANQRREAAETTIISLKEAMEKQRNEDPSYREWSNTSLPDGVAARLREAARSTTDNSN